MQRTKIEYRSTSDITAEIKIDGQVIHRITSFEFYHDVDGLPVATITFNDPEVNITSLDSMLIKKERTNDEQRME